MEIQKNIFSKVIVLFVLVTIVSCKNITYSKYPIPIKVHLIVNNNTYDLNENKKIKHLMKDINNGKLLNDTNFVPYIYDVCLIYKDTIINLKSDGVYYLDNSYKIYPKNDLVKRYWKLEDKDLLPIRTLQKLK